MLIAAGILFTLFILVFRVLNNIFLGYGLTASLLFFTFIGIKKGYSLRKIIDLYWTETKKSLNIILILVLIGMLISSWLSCGTIPSIIYYSLKYLNPNLFILSAFLITALISMLIGTSFGTVSAVGIPLIIIGRAAGINLNILGGAIFSLKYPLSFVDNKLNLAIYNYFNVSIVLLLPAVILFALSMFKVKITYSIPVSVLCAFVLDMVVQGNGFGDFVKSLVFGYSNDSEVLKSIIHGGGIISMLKTCYIIVISCSLSGFFSGLNVFDNLKQKLKEKNLSKASLFLVTVGLGIINAAIGCSQTIAIILTLDIVKDLYEDCVYADCNKFAKQELSLDISNSAILTPALIPWCIAALVPCSILGIGSYGYIVFAFYLYIVPVVHYVRRRFVG